jgi:hypothetical protein
MFLQGEMPRDSFGGESRDLEPFGGLEPFWARNAHRASYARNPNSQESSGPRE